MIKAIAIANQKGGVGKTTTAINLAVGLLMARFRVLLVDLDPQANATSGLGIAPSRDETHFLAIDAHHAVLPRLWQQARDGGLMLVPSGPLLARIDRSLAGRLQSGHRLLQHLRRVSGRFDYVVIDCPPSVGPLTINALVAADSVLIPIQSEYLAMEGLSQMLALIRQVQASENPALSLEGILITLHDANLELSAEVEQELREHVGQAVYETRIARDVALAECPSHGKAIIDYAPQSPGSWAYQRFVQEFLARQVPAPSGRWEPVAAATEAQPAAGEARPDAAAKAPAGEGPEGPDPAKHAPRPNRAYARSGRNRQRPKRGSA